jgi:hypothetical protein
MRCSVPTDHVPCSLTFITATTCEEELQPNSHEIGKYAPVPFNVLRVCGYTYTVRIKLQTGMT